MPNDWYGRSLVGAELTGAATYQPVIVNSNILLKAVKTLIMIYNDPVFTLLTAKIYTDRSGLPFKEIHASTTFWNKSLLTTEPNALKEIYFDFNDVPLQAETKYHVVFQCATYTGTDASHLAMMTYFPDVSYKIGITENQKNLSTMPIHLVLIGASL